MDDDWGYPILTQDTFFLGNFTLDNGDFYASEVVVEWEHHEIFCWANGDSLRYSNIAMDNHPKPFMRIFT